MSNYTDYMEEMFFNRVMEVRETINDYEKWIEDYLEKRKKYPEWVTRDGKHIPVGEVTDSHLENLLNFLPENTAWHKAFEYEKTYRRLKEKLISLKKEDIENEKTIDLVY